MKPRHKRQRSRTNPLEKLLSVVTNVLVAIRHHREHAVPKPLNNDRTRTMNAAICDYSLPRVAGRGTRCGGYNMLASTTRVD